MFINESMGSYNYKVIAKITIMTLTLGFLVSIFTTQIAQAKDESKSSAEDNIINYANSLQRTIGNLADGPQKWLEMFGPPSTGPWSGTKNNVKFLMGYGLFLASSGASIGSMVGISAKGILNTLDVVYKATVNIPAYTNYMLGRAHKPEGMTRVYPKSDKHPDGAQHFNSLEFDKSSPAGQNIIASRRSALAGDALKNGIYYGDAGTGKSSFVRSFAHEKNFEVYSLSGENMTVNEFTNLYKWLVQKSSSKRRIYIDLSEGDNLLNLITGTTNSGWSTNDEFKNLFKSLYDSAQQNFALIISCNYNSNVEKAIDTIVSTESLKRRFPTQIRFEVPNYPIRLKLFKAKALSVIEQTSSFANEEIRQEAKDFFTSLLNVRENKDWIRDILVKYTEGLSHNGVNTIASELVYVWIGHNDMLQRGQDLETSEWDELFDADSEVAEISSIDTRDYKTVLSDYLKLPSATRDWIKLEKEKLLQQQIEEMDRSIPLLKRQAEIAELERLIYSGQYDKAKEKAKEELNEKDSKQKAQVPSDILKQETTNDSLFSNFPAAPAA